ERSEAETASRHGPHRTVFGRIRKQFGPDSILRRALRAKLFKTTGHRPIAMREDEMHGYCWDAYYTHLELEYQAHCLGSHRPSSEEWPVPLRWVMTSIGGLSLVSLGFGSLAQWLL